MSISGFQQSTCLDCFCSEMQNNSTRLTVMIPSIRPLSCFGPCSLSMAHLSIVEATPGSSTFSSLKPVMLTPL